jgi:hypothetical protein
LYPEGSGMCWRNIYFLRIQTWKWRVLCCHLNRNVCMNILLYTAVNITWPLVVDNLNVWIMKHETKPSLATYQILYFSELYLIYISLFSMYPFVWYTLYLVTFMTEWWNIIILYLWGFRFSWQWTWRWQPSWI